MQNTNPITLMSFLIDPQNRCRPHLQDLCHGGRTFPPVLNLILEIFTLSTLPLQYFL